MMSEIRSFQDYYGVRSCGTTRGMADLEYTTKQQRAQPEQLQLIRDLIDLAGQTLVKG